MSLSAEQSRHVSEITDAIRNTNAEHTPPVPYGRRELRFERPLVMGILNVTPDSFSDGGECLTKEAAVRKFQEMVSEGADIIDIGAESTRPGAVPISEDEELSRLLPVLREVVSSKVPVSVDTRHASVAEEAVRAGASIVNDISGLRDPEMTEVVARSGCPVVAMHMRGDPQNMQSLTVYEDLLGDIHTELARILQRAEAGGIQREKVILDPGIGFAKTTEQNLEIIRRLGELRSLGRPLLIGASRKRFIGEISGGGPKERLAGSIAAAVMAVTNGANIVRVHDVAPTVQALKVAHAVISPTARPY
ncbi:MAG: dihydropteroate synthase [Methanomassiliicoccales archaeon]|nr:MAG: dihydropteroate synthase [Methanomassiliicoccales archaeon]